MPQVAFFLAENRQLVDDDDVRPFPSGKLSVDVALCRGDLVPEKLIKPDLIYGLTFFYEVVAVRRGTMICVVKTGMVVGKNYRRKKRITVKSEFGTFQLLRRLFNHQPCTKTRSSFRIPCSCSFAR